MEDVYNDLDNYEHVNDVEKIQAENDDLKYKIGAITQELEKLKEDYDKLHIEYKKLETNYSSLLKTAKAEIERKTQLITTLNTEKDQLVLRYLSTNRYPPYRKKFCGKPNNIEKDCKGDNENIESGKNKCDVQVQNNDRNSKQTKSITDSTCKNIELDKNNQGKNTNIKPKNATQRRKSVLETISPCYSSFSSEDEEFNASNDKNVKKKMYKDPNKTKHTYDSKRKYDKINRDQSKSRLPRGSRDTRNKYETNERYSTHRHRERDDRHYPSRNKETSPKPTRSHNSETREENRRKEMSPKPTRYHSSETREENRNKEMSPKPSRRYIYEIRLEKRNKETSPKPTRHYENRDENRNKEASSKSVGHYNIENRKENRNKETSPKLTRHSNYKNREGNRNKEIQIKPTRHCDSETKEENRNRQMNPNSTYCNIETGQGNQNRDLSPEPTGHYNFETQEDNLNKEEVSKPTWNDNLGTIKECRNKEMSPELIQPCNFETKEESHIKRGGDEKNILQCSPNGTRPNCSRWDRGHREDEFDKNFHTTNQNFEKDKHFETLPQEIHNNKKRKYKLTDDNNDILTSKRQRDDKTVTVDASQNNIESPINIPLSLYLVQSPDEETVANVSTKGCTVVQVNEIKLVDPRLTSEKYVQIIDMDNRTSLSTINGRRVELKLLHYDYTEDTHCTSPCSLKNTCQLSEDFTDEIYKNIDIQVSNLLPEPGEIIECFDLVNMPVNNDEYLKDCQREKIENTKNVSSFETKRLQSIIQTVEDDLELSEDSCDNNDHKSKISNKFKTKDVMSKHNLKPKEGKVKNCDMVEISEATDKNQTIYSKDDVANMADLQDRENLITLEDLNLRSQGVDSSSLGFQGSVNTEFHSSNEKVTIVSHDLNLVLNNANCNIDHVVSNADTGQHGLATIDVSQNSKDNKNTESCKNGSHNESKNILKLNNKGKMKEQEKNHYNAITVEDNITTPNEDTLQNSHKDEDSSPKPGDDITFNNVSITVTTKGNETREENTKADGNKNTSAAKMDTGNKSKQKKKSDKYNKLSDKTDKRKGREKKKNSDKITERAIESFSKTHKDVIYPENNSSANPKLRDCDDLEKITNKIDDQNDESKQVSGSVSVENSENISIIMNEIITRETKKTMEECNVSTVAITEENKGGTENDANSIRIPHKDFSRKRKEIETCSNLPNSKSNVTNKERKENALDPKEKSYKTARKKNKTSTKVNDGIVNINDVLKHDRDCERNESIVINTDVSLKESKLSRIVNSAEKLNLNPELSVHQDKKMVEIHSRIDDNIIRYEEYNSSKYVALEEMSSNVTTPIQPTERSSHSPELVINLVHKIRNTTQSCMKEQGNEVIQPQISDLNLSQSSIKDHETPVVRIFVPRRTSIRRPKTSSS